MKQQSLLSQSSHSTEGTQTPTKAKHYNMSHGSKFIKKRKNKTGKENMSPGIGIVFKNRRI